MSCLTAVQQMSETIPTPLQTDQSKNIIIREKRQQKLNSQPVMIKSSKNGINLILDDKIPFEELLEEIKKKFIDSEKFFKDAHIAISFEGRSLSQDEQFEIVETIQQCTTITIICILDHDELIRHKREVPHKLSCRIVPFNVLNGIVEREQISQYGVVFRIYLLQILFCLVGL